MGRGLASCGPSALFHRFAHAILRSATASICIAFSVSPTRSKQRFSARRSAPKCATRATGALARMETDGFVALEQAPSAGRADDPYDADAQMALYPAGCSPVALASFADCQVGTEPHYERSHVIKGIIARCGRRWRVGVVKTPLAAALLLCFRVFALPNRLCSARRHLARDCLPKSHRFVVFLGAGLACVSHGGDISASTVVADQHAGGERHGAHPCPTTGK